MKYVFFSNQGLGPKHLGIELEVINDLKADKNNEVYSVSCNSVLKGCFFNPTKNIFGCALCQERTKNCHKLVNIDKSFKLTKFKFNYQPPQINSLKDLLKIEYDNVKIGLGVASSLISITRDFEISTAKFGDLIKELCHVAIQSLENFKEIIAKHNPDGIYLFNGRFAETNGVIELCKELNIDYYTIEVASPGRYYVFKNSLPHSIKTKKGIMNAMWKDETLDFKKKIAINFYEAKVKGNVKGRKNFINSQQKELLPKDFDDSKYNIVFFNSSEDEMKVIDEWQHNYYDSQNDAILKIVNSNLKDSGVHFYLRVHPNLSQVKNKQVEELENLRSYNNITIIDADSKVDTYGIMRACDMTITFGSTMGIEATYWGKPSLFIGRTFYEDTNAVYKVKSFEEIDQHIAQRLSNPKPKESTYKYAYYFSKYGTPFKHFEYVDKNDAMFKGIRFKSLYPSTIFTLLKYFKHIPTWLKLHKTILGKGLKVKHVLKLYNQIPK